MRLAAAVLGIVATSSGIAAVLAPAAASAAAPSARAERPAPASADTIHLRGGGVIHTESARVVGDRVVFTQHGGSVSIPLAVVVAVDDDETSEESRAGSRPTAGPAPRSTSPASNTIGGDAPWASAEYWIERLARVDEQIAVVRAELERLPRYRETDLRQIVSGQMLYFAAQRQKWEAWLGRLTEQRRELERGARRAGIPPGALRGRGRS